MDFSGRVDTATRDGSPSPKVRKTSRAKSRQPATSSTTCSAVQKMCESSWVNPRARSIPLTTPERS
jgi:hypothetical protein